MAVIVSNKSGAMCSHMFWQVLHVGHVSTCLICVNMLFARLHVDFEYMSQHIDIFTGLVSSDLGDQFFG